MLLLSQILTVGMLIISIFIIFKRKYIYELLFSNTEKKAYEIYQSDGSAGNVSKTGRSENGNKLMQNVAWLTFLYPVIMGLVTYMFGYIGVYFSDDGYESHRWDNAATNIATLVAGISFITITRWWQYLGNTRKQLDKQNVINTDTEFGSAKFDETPNYLAELVDKYPVYLGGFAILPLAKKYHLLTIAPTRSGKGVNLIIPNLLMASNSSMVVLDIKGENAAITARFQKSSGKDVVILDPWGVQDSIGATHGISPTVFNPLSVLETMNDEQIFEECTSIAELIVPMPKNVKEPFWIKRARVLIRGLLLHHIKTELPNNWNLLSLYKALRLSDIQFMAHIMLGCDTPLAADDLNQFRGKTPDDKTFSSILSQAQDATEFIRNVSKAGVSFNPNQINEKPTVVYLCIPEKAIENNYQWLRLVIGLCVRSISENVKNKQVERTVFLLDEAHYLGDMPEIRKALATSATYGTCIWQFFQDIGQVQAAYGDYWHSIMNVGVRQFYKINDLNTQKYVSELIGDYTLTLFNKTTGKDGATSTSESKTAARLLTAEQVGKVTKIITQIDGKNLLLNPLPYYEADFMSINADKNPLN